jgi:C-terminal processing protease CtpA/Prc
MEGIVSLFMKGKFKPLTEEFRASKEELLMWKSGLQNWFERPYYLARDAFEQIVKLIEDSISKGLFLTPKTTLWGDQLIQGNGSYTKPVIVLVDYYAGSCGDAFPAMMQGLGRAKLLGTATGGLGGYVQPMEPLFYSQITYDMTQSLFFHPDGHAIENVGAIPDIDYEITIDDFVNGFTGYRTFYTEELLKLIY